MISKQHNSVNNVVLHNLTIINKKNIIHNAFHKLNVQEIKRIKYRDKIDERESACK